MKIGKDLPNVTAITPQDGRRPLPASGTFSRQTQPAAEERAAVRRGLSAAAGFNIQLNRQLSSMQLAERYLSDLENRLSQLKLSLGRVLTGAAQQAEKAAIQREIREINQLLEQRARRTGNALGPTLKLSLNEPARTRFSIQGLESIEAIQRAGKETLLFSAGRQLSEPVAVVLDEGLSEQQILRRFNATLGQAGIRAELDDNGALKFTARESDWQQIKPELMVQGEGKLFAADRPTPVVSHEEQAIQPLPTPEEDSERQLRSLLDTVLAALDKVSQLREQLSARQKEVREFLAQHADQDEREWADGFAKSVFSVMHRSPSSYSAVLQAVAAQANLSRYAVVSLLS